MADRSTAGRSALTREIAGSNPAPPAIRDGLYQVITRYLCAGFIVRNGRVARQDCAPILWTRLAYWKTVARFIAP
jgi:hypothetical protein